MTTTMTRGFGDCIRPVLLCCALYVLAMCTVAGGQTPTGLGHSAEEFLRPVVSQRQFTDLIRPLELSREQRLIVELVYEDYRDAIDLAKREKDREADAKEGELSLMRCRDGGLSRRMSFATIAWRC
jgi:hypothetical protein